jgi:hypothetical protein
MLPLDAGTTVSTDRLIEGLWGAGRRRRQRTDIVTRDRGYELRLRPDDVDACRFKRLLEHGAAREALALCSSAAA